VCGGRTWGYVWVCVCVCVKERECMCVCERERDARYDERAKTVLLFGKPITMKQSLVALPLK
jgi:hypothetical protein